MITKLSIVHFKAIASATVPLGPITVLVGPNDSGKSTILQALLALAHAKAAERVHVEQLLGCPPLVAATNGDASSDIVFAIDGVVGAGAGESPHSYRYKLSPLARQRSFGAEEAHWDEQQILSAAIGTPTVVKGKPVEPRTEPFWSGDSSELSFYANGHWVGDSEIRPMFRAIGADLDAVLLRLDARAIAKPSPLGEPLLSDGSGLVGVIDELLTGGLGDEQIGRINQIIRTLSPHVKGMAAKLHPSGGKELHFALRSGTVVPAAQMSDGIVLATALAVISTVKNPRLLIEEPENGLHPRQLKIVADTIRTIAAAGTQIVLTTHSPLLLNHFGAEEVVLVTRTAEGVRAQRMSEANGLAELASEMALGELWYNVGDSNLAR